jgi:hypothetical protein
VHVAPMICHLGWQDRQTTGRRSEERRMVGNVDVDVDVAVDVSRVALDADTQAANGSCKTKIIFYWISDACFNN